MTSPLPVVAGTLQTDPRSGGLKRSSGVNVLHSVAQAWSEVRDDLNTSVDWIIVGYDGPSKTDITVIAKGNGGVDACSRELPKGRPVFGGCRLQNGRFATFFYADEDTPTMQKGRASMHKNGVLNVLEGSDGEIDMKEDIAPKETVNECSAAQPKPISLATDGGLSSNVASKSDPSSAAIETGMDTCVDVAIPYETLRDIVDASYLPRGVDPLNREQALTDDEFIAVFGIDKQSFQQLPGWKRTKLKKERGLF